MRHCHTARRPCRDRRFGARGADPPAAEELAGLLAHDLRTPLNAVRGFADLLLAGAAGPLAAGPGRALAEIARAGRALEAAVALAQELGELPVPAADAEAASRDSRHCCAKRGFALRRASSGRAARRLAGTAARWRRLLAACHAHLPAAEGAAPLGRRLRCAAAQDGES